MISSSLPVDSYPSYLYELFGRLDHIGYREEIMELPIDKSQWGKVKSDGDYAHVWNDGRAGWLAEFSPDQYYLAYSLDGFIFRLKRYHEIMEIPRIVRYDDGSSELFCVELLEQIQRVYLGNEDMGLDCDFFREASSLDMLRYLSGVYDTYGVRNYNVIKLSQLDGGRLSALLQPFCERVVILEDEDDPSVKYLLFVPLDGFREFFEVRYKNGFVFLETDDAISSWLNGASDRKRISDLAFSSRVHLYEFSDVPAPDRLQHERILAVLLSQTKAYLAAAKIAEQTENQRNLEVVERMIKKGLSGERITDTDIDELTKITYTDYVPKSKDDTFEVAKNAVLQFRSAFIAHDLEAIHEVYSVKSEMEKVEELLNAEYAKFEVIDTVGDFWFTQEIQMSARGARKYLFQGNLITDGGYYWTEDFYVYIFPSGTPNIHYYKLSPGQAIPPDSDNTSL
jgi:hypothetical protein